MEFDQNKIGNKLFFMVDDNGNTVDSMCVDWSCMCRCVDDDVDDDDDDGGIIQFRRGVDDGSESENLDTF
jgi:hypothetical protein